MKSKKILVRLTEEQAYMFKRACAAVGVEEPAVMARMLIEHYNAAFKSSDKSLGYKPVHPPEFLMTIQKKVTQLGQWNKEGKQTP
jgi:hypothetical protein